MKYNNKQEEKRRLKKLAKIKEPAIELGGAYYDEDSKRYIRTYAWRGVKITRKVMNKRIRKMPSDEIPTGKSTMYRKSKGNAKWEVL